MKQLYNNIVTFLFELDPIVKVLIVGLLCIFDIFIILKIVKTHANAKKTVFKVGQFILLAIFILLTIFVCAHI